MRRIALLAIGIGFVYPASADILQWNSTAPASFSDPGSWLTGVVPGPADIALFGWDPKFTAAQSIQVSFPNNSENLQLAVQSAAHNFDLGGNTYTLNSISRDGPDSSVIIGDNLLSNGRPGFAQLNIINGTVVPQGTILGMAQGNSGVLNVGAGGVWNGQDFLDVGLNGSGALNIRSGGIVNNLDAAIAGDTTTSLNTLPGSVGSVLVSGPGSQWNNNGNILSVGDVGQGSLTIQASGLITSAGDTLVGTNPGASGTILVTGPQSTFSHSGVLEVGSSGQGSLTIQDGGLVTGFKGSVANLDGTGQVLVTGPNSQWTLSSDLQVGQQGQGSLSILGGASVSNFNGSVGVLTADPGFQTVGKVLVDGTGSTWSNSGLLTVGGGFVENETGQGSVLVQNGARVSNTLLATIGASPGSVGDVRVTGPGSLWDDSLGLLIVGALGQGSLEITNGATVLSFGSDVGAAPGSSGTVLVSGAGSLWANQDTVLIGSPGDGTLITAAGAGYLTVSDGGTVVATTLTVGPTGILDGDGGLVIANVVDDGVIQPGSSMGTGQLVIQGNLNLAQDGTIALNIAGSDISQYSGLLVSGNGTFNGLISVDFINGFSPFSGQLFRLIGVGGSLDFTGVTIQVEGLPSDYSYENLFQGGYSLLILGPQASVPEPATVGLAAGGLLALLAARRFRIFSNAN